MTGKVTGLRRARVGIVTARGKLRASLQTRGEQGAGRKGDGDRPLGRQAASGVPAVSGCTTVPRPSPLAAALCPTCIAMLYSRTSWKRLGKVCRKATAAAGCFSSLALAMKVRWLILKE